MSYMPSMQYLDVSYDSTDNLALGAQKDQTIRGGQTLKKSNFLSNENSLVNLRDHTQSIGSIENFNPLDHHQQSSQNINV